MRTNDLPMEIRKAEPAELDTHENNRVMQRAAERYGFKKCGTIYVADGSPRIAYQWNRTGTPEDTE